MKWIIGLGVAALAIIVLIGVVLYAVLTGWSNHG